MKLYEWSQFKAIPQHILDEIYTLYGTNEPTVDQFLCWMFAQILTLRGDV